MLQNPYINKKQWLPTFYRQSPLHGSLLLWFLKNLNSYRQWEVGTHYVIIFFKFSDFELEFKWGFTLLQRALRYMILILWNVFTSTPSHLFVISFQPYLTVPPRTTKLLKVVDNWWKLVTNIYIKSCISWIHKFVHRYTRL